MTDENPSQRPRLAYVYHPRSVPTLALAEAARDICDLIWVIDGSDPEAKSMSRLLKRLGTVVDVAGCSLEQAAGLVAVENPDGILALADGLLLWTSELAERLNLPGNSPVVAGRLTDKHAQRTALKQGGLPVPGFWRVDESDTESALARIAVEATFPVVLKPRNGEGSSDTLAAASFDELHRLFETVHMSTEGLEREFVVEEFIPDFHGEIGGADFAGYVSVESYVSDGHVVHLGVTGRTPVAPPFRETGLFIPSALADADTEQVLDMAGRAAEALGVVSGCLHTEIKLTPTGPVVIEVNGRIGGGVADCLRAATGVEFLPMAFRLALGADVAVEALPRTSQVGYHLMVQAPEHLRRVTSVEGLETLAALDGVDEISLNRGNDGEVSWREGNTGAVMMITGHVPDHDRLREFLDRVEATVVIRGEMDATR